MRSSIVFCLGLAACGGGGGAGTDADPDAPTPPVGNISITTYGSNSDPSGLKPGVDIVAIDPDGSTSTATTGPEGTTTLTIAAGASVSAMYPDQFDGRYEVWTVLAAEPGDELVFGDAERIEYGVPTADMDVTVPSIAGGYAYFVYGACGGESVAAPMTTITIHQFANCEPATQDLFLVATNVNNDILGYGVLPATPFTAGGSVALTAWLPPGSLALDAAGIPPQVNRASMLAAMRLPSGPGHVQGELDLAPTGGSVSWTAPSPPVGDAIEVRLTLVTLEGPTQWTSDVIDAAATSHTFADVAALPWVSEIVVDPATSSLSFTAAGGRAPDATWLSFSYAPEEFGQYYEWLVVAPPTTDGANTITIPTLPAPFDGANLVASGSSSDAFVSLLDFVGADGYDDARPLSVNSMHGGVRVSELYTFWP